MYTVLIADDEPFVREGLKELIPWENLGFRLLAAYGNGADLLAHTEREMPDLIITDIQMPVMTGLELAAKLRERQEGVALVFLTAYSDFAYAKQAIAYQVKNYILKSSLLEDLPKVLEGLRLDLDEKREERAERGKAAPQEEAELIAAIKAYIHARYQENISLEDIAGAVYANRSYVSRMFKKKTGENLFDYLNRYRIEQAKICIARGNKKIYEVAVLVGLEDTAYFSKVFKKYTGYAPKEYEKMSRGE